MSPTALRNQQSPIVLIAIILLGLIAGYFYYSQVLQGQPTSIAPSTVLPNDTLSKFKDFKFNFSILDDPQFKSLKIFGDSPVLPGQTGKPDAFSK